MSFRNIAISYIIDPPMVWSYDFFLHHINYEGGSESSVIGVITLFIDMIDCCFIP